MIEVRRCVRTPTCSVSHDLALAWNLPSRAALMSGSLDILICLHVVDMIGARGRTRCQTRCARMEHDIRSNPKNDEEAIVVYPTNQQPTSHSVSYPLSQSTNPNAPNNHSFELLIYRGDGRVNDRYRVPCILQNE